MFIAIIALFILGYTLIITEHTVKIDKAATALFIGVGCWVLLVMGVMILPASSQIAFSHYQTLHPDNQHGLIGFF